MRLLRRLQYLLNKDQFERELNEEIAHHHSLAEEDALRSGLSPDDARRAAAVQLGNPVSARESARSVWGWQTIEGILQDIRYAARGLNRNRSLVAVACLSIALSTGFGTTLFSVVNATILQPITASKPAELARFWVGEGNRISWLNYREICEQSPTVLCTGYRMENVSLRAGGESMMAQTQVVTSNYFQLLGVQAARGRLFDADSTQENRNLAVVTHAFWQRHLGGDPKVIGRRIVLGVYPYTVTAVLPQGFRSLFGLGIAPPLYVPAGSAIRPFSTDRAHAEYELLGRVPEGENAVSFRERVLVRAQQVEHSWPKENRQFGRVQIFSLSRFGLLFSQNDQSMMTGIIIFAGLLMVFVLLLAMVACMNVAGLLISRALSRQREIAVRLSLGCDRWRLSRLLFAESFLLALMGTAAGAAVSLFLARMLVAVPMPFPVPLELEVPIDGYLLAYLTMLTGICTVIAGFAPAIQAWRMKAIGETARSPRSIGSARFSGRALLPTIQVALSTVLLVATMLFVRSLSNAVKVNPGFDLDRVVTVELDTATEHLQEAQLEERQQSVIARIRSAPGVTAVAGSDIVPLSLDSNVTSLEIDAGATRPMAAKVNNNSVLPEYFRAMGISRLAGRDFTAHDRQLRSAVIVNQTFAKRLFPTGTPVGKRVRKPRGANDPPDPWAEIVGVVADSKYLTLGEDPAPLVYWPIEAGAPLLKIYARTEGDAGNLAAQLSSVLGRDARVHPLRSVMAIALFPAQAAAVLLAALGIVGWVLTIAGVYGWRHIRLTGASLRSACELRWARHDSILCGLSCAKAS